MLAHDVTIAAGRSLSSAGTTLSSRRNAPSRRRETPMSTGSKLLLLASLFAVLDSPLAWAAQPELCTAGRFAVAGAPLLGPGGEVVILDNQSIAIGTLCAPRRAKLGRRKKGAGGKVEV